MSGPATAEGAPDACPSPDELVELAQRRTGLDDFGDPELQAPLAALLAAFQQQAWPRMSRQARAMAVETLSGYLAARARILDDRKRYPAIAEEEVRAPFIVVGPPRSGSTLLHTLLSLDPANIAPPHWTCLEPSPPPGLAPPAAERLERAAARLTRFFDQIPDLYVQHAYLLEAGANSLGECGSDIMSMALTTKAFWYYYPVDSYIDHLMTADHGPALRFHRQFLQHSQWRGGGRRWALKGADHMIWLPALAAEYPDAILLWTHRDLAELMSSITSVFFTCRGVSGAPDPAARPAMAAEAVRLEVEIFAKALHDRDALGEARFHDISYHEMLADPLGAVEDVYARFGLELSAPARDHIRHWIAENPQTKHGVHRHSADASGLEGSEVNRLFADYRARFGFGFNERARLRI